MTCGHALATFHAHRKRMRRSYGVGATRAALAGTCCRGRRGATIGTAAGVGVSVADREERPDVPRGRMGEGVPRGRSGPTARMVLVAAEVTVAAARAGVRHVFPSVASSVAVVFQERRVFSGQVLRWACSNRAGSTCHTTGTDPL